MLNQITLVGRLVKDVEMKGAKTTEKDSRYANITVAVDNDFIPVTVFGQSAEYLSKNGKKGTLIMTQGAIKQNVYEKDGNKVYSLQINSNKVEILSQPQNKNETPSE